MYDEDIIRPQMLYFVLEFNEVTSLAKYQPGVWDMRAKMP